MKKSILTLSALMLAHQAFATDYVFYTEKWPYHNYVHNGVATGVQTEIVKEMAKRAGINARISLMDWVRSYNAALRKDNACVFSTNITKERENLFKWVRPIGQSDWIMYRKKGSNVTAETLEEVREKNYKVSVYLKDARELYLNNLGGFNLDVQKDAHTSYKHTAEGRSDLFFSDPEFITDYQKQKKENLLEPLFTARSVDLGLACNKQISDSVIESLQKALDDMKEDGSFDQIREREIKKYLER